jgi:hypothetical protein
MREENASRKLDPCVKLFFLLKALLGFLWRKSIDIDFALFTSGKDDHSLTGIFQLHSTECTA